MRCPREDRSERDRTHTHEWVLSFYVGFRYADRDHTYVNAIKRKIT